eukprot:GHVU01132803.1.p1 GENE.GHVU01132803.1~~GHVU01132803.1.p1  ORF type:complete len:152 (+),score=13.28 GHVU01132803.1:169-624(+)
MSSLKNRGGNGSMTNIPLTSEDEAVNSIAAEVGRTSDLSPASAAFISYLASKRLKDVESVRIDEALQNVPAFADQKYVPAMSTVTKASVIMLPVTLLLLFCLSMAAVKIAYPYTYDENNVMIAKRGVCRAGGGVKRRGETGMAPPTAVGAA